ncbi:transposase [Microbacterium sp. ISL-59]|uniref:Mu transposase C-terminal domain-containing protein n=1 Tax=Microbacterium sp. ISL-59 TaxID=2819159 RepID=UPI001BE77A8F|nr:Mu transposase C-terminal domain-containing protein [Microbacterium sp. ISL-59]MBT2496202.1 transposase [Microbacterium sp. ISL-59]
MIAQRTVTLGQTVHLEAGDFTLVSFANGSYRLRDDLTGDYQVMHHLELAAQMPPGETLETSDPIDAKPIDEVLDGLDETKRAVIPFLQQLIDGTPVDGGDPLPEFATHVSKTKRLDSTVLALSKAGFEVPLGTLKRRLTAFEQKGVAGLVDRREGRKEKAFARVPEAVQNALAKLIVGYENKSTVTYTVIRAELKAMLMDQFPDPADRPKAPSLSTVERLVKHMGGDQNPVLPAKRRETAALSPKRMHRSRQVFGPGDECQMDATELDILVRMPNNEIGRPHLTALVDKRTRSVVGLNLTEAPPKAIDHAVLLANALVPRKIRAWAKDYDAFGLPQMPWSKHLSKEQLETYDSYRPYIFPSRILIDNGQDFRGTVFGAGCDRYGISLTQTPIHDPTAKAIVERFFHSVKTKFCQFVPGYSGGDVLNRGKDVAKGPLLTLAELAELLDKWTALVWQNRRHEGLDDDYRKNWSHSPNSMYAACVELTGHFVLAFQEEDFIALLPRDERTVQSDGIEMNGRMYDSPHLGPLRNRKRSNNSTPKVVVSYDPSDEHRIWLRSSGDAGWITCYWIEERGRSRPLADAISLEAHRRTLETLTFSDEEADDLMVRFRNEAMTESTDRVQAAALEQKKKDKETKATETLAAVLTPTIDSSHDFSIFAKLDIG